MIFNFWPSDLVKAWNRMQNNPDASPKFGSKDYWVYRCALGEARMHHQTMGNYEGVPLLALNSINAKQDDMNEYRYLMQADLMNRDCYPRAMAMLRRMHGPLTQMLQLLTANSTDARANSLKRKKDAETAARDEQRREDKRRLACESIISQMMRLRSKDNAPFLTVCKSIVALRQGLHRRYWAMESRMGLLMGYTWTLKMALEMTERGVEPPFEPSSKISFVVYDNCDYRRKKQFQRTDDAGEYIKTVNIVEVPVKASDYELSPQEMGDITTPYGHMPHPYAHM